MGLCFVFSASTWQRQLIKSTFKPLTKLWLKPLDLSSATAFRLLHSAVSTPHVLVPADPADSLRRDKLEGKKLHLPYPIAYNVFHDCNLK